jgi:hypothetical protein
MQLAFESVVLAAALLIPGLGCVAEGTRAADEASSRSGRADAAGRRLGDAQSGGLRVKDKGVLGPLIVFARRPSRGTWAAVPFAARVRLGLADRLLVSRSAGELRNRRAWWLESPGKYFRGYVGPFSALKPLTSGRPFAFSVGPHAHCASPPAAPPPEVKSLRRLSVQPRTVTSCLEWFTVDVFVTRSGWIRAITLDLYEP